MKLLLVDATNVVMRCASVTDVAPAAVVRTAVGIVRRATQTVGATHVVAAFDSPGDGIRREVYPPYKANRTTDTASWVDAAVPAFRAASIYCASAPRYEADDVIATIARRMPRQSAVAILSGDSDLLALLDHRPHRTRVDETPDISVWQFEKGAPGGIVERSATWVCEKYGIPSPAHLTLYKALVGETGDNVPGVPKVGPVRARKLIAEFGDFQVMKKLGVLNEHTAWAEQAITLLSLYDFAPVPPIAPRETDVQLLNLDRGAA